MGTHAGQTQNRVCFDIWETRRGDRRLRFKVPQSPGGSGWGSGSVFPHRCFLGGLTSVFAKCYLIYVIQYTKAPMTVFKVLNLITFDQFCFKKNLILFITMHWVRLWLKGLPITAWYVMPVEDQSCSWKLKLGLDLRSWKWKCYCFVNPPVPDLTGSNVLAS